MLKLRPAWQRLEQSDSATMFQSFAWNHLAARVFSDRESPYVVYAETDNSSTLIPGAVDAARARITLLGESLFDYRDILSDGSSDSSLPPAWQALSEHGLNFSTAAIRQDAAFLRCPGFALNKFYGAPRVSPDAVTPDQFASDHGRLGRWRRRLEREGVPLRCHPGQNTELVRFIYRQKSLQSSEDGNNLFADPLRQDFMAAVAEAMGSACEIFTLESAGGLVAALVTFLDRHVRRFYTIYFDQSWAKYSPGMVLLYEVTRRSLEAGIECDYMTGEHAYKMRFATSVVPMYWAEASAESIGACSFSEFQTAARLAS